MHTRYALLVLSIAVTACAGSPGRPAILPLGARAAVQPTAHADSRLGPPNALGLGMRRIDRAIASEAPLAHY